MKRRRWRPGSPGWRQQSPSFWQGVRLTYKSESERKQIFKRKIGEFNEKSS